MTPSRRFIMLELCLLGGLAGGTRLPIIWLADWDWRILGWLWLTVLLGCWMLARQWSHHLVRELSLIVGMMLLGGLWTVGYRTTHRPPVVIYDRPVVITGRVSTYPEIIGRQQTFFLETTDFGRRTRFSLQTSREPRYDRDTLLAVTGVIQVPTITAAFNQQRWLEGQGATGLIRWPTTIEVIGPPTAPWQRITRLRDALLATINRALPEPAASLGNGLTLGVRPTIDRELKESLQQTNLTHLAAVSGQNVSLTILIVYGFLRRISLHLATVICFILLACYTVLTGGDASIVRAAVMTSGLFLTPFLGRPFESLRSLLLTAVVLTVFNPLSLTHDLGFQLSFVALAGIILIGPSIGRILQFVPSFLRQTCQTILGATLGVLPLQWATFGTISLVGPLANLLVTPIVLGAMASSFALGIGGTLLPWLAASLGLVAYLPLELIHRLAVWLADLPSSQITLALSPIAKAVLLCLELIGLLYLGYRSVLPAPRPRWVGRDEH